jgi:hypothetical protein
VTRWLETHRATITSLLEPGETLRDADRVIAAHRRSVRHVPRVGFVLAVTDRRLVALKASAWLARPERVVMSWAYDDGARLASAAMGRLRLVLPDRSVVTLRAFGLHRITHLAPD